MIVEAREITANALDYRIEQLPINEHPEAHHAPPVETEAETSAEPAGSTS